MREFPTNKWIARLFAMPLACRQSVFELAGPVAFFEAIDRIISYFSLQHYFSIQKADSLWVSSYGSPVGNNIKWIPVLGKNKFLKNE